MNFYFPICFDIDEVLILCSYIGFVHHPQNTRTHARRRARTQIAFPLYQENMKNVSYVNSILSCVVKPRQKLITSLNCTKRHAQVKTKFVVHIDLYFSNIFGSLLNSSTHKAVSKFEYTCFNSRLPTPERFENCVRSFKSKTETMHMKGVHFF